MGAAAGVTAASGANAGERAERTLSDTIGADAPRDRDASVEILSDVAAFDRSNANGSADGDGANGAADADAGSSDGAEQRCRGRRRRQRGWRPVKVLLRDDVDGVGRRGDIVKVAGGFARNFLLPEGRAIVASDGVEGQAEQMRRGRDLREAKSRGEAESQATILAGAVIPISARAGGGGRLFGSIGPADVVEAIRVHKGVEIDRKHVLLPEHIKEVGSFDVTVELFTGVATVVTVEVTAAS